MLEEWDCEECSFSFCSIVGSFFVSHFLFLAPQVIKNVVVEIIEDFSLFLFLKFAVKS